MIVLKNDNVVTRVNRFGEEVPVCAPCCFDGEVCQRIGWECVRSGAVGFTVFGEAYESDDDVCERFCEEVPRYVGFRVSEGFWYGKLAVSGVWVQLFRVEL